MKAAILVIGDELLGGRCQDTNSGWLCGALCSLGIGVSEVRSGPDDMDWIAAAMSDLSDDCDLLLVTGGLGPTPDDLTREGLAKFLNVELVEDERAFSWIEASFIESGLEMNSSQSRLATRPSGATCHRNHAGTAPSIHVDGESCAIWLLPGPPRELHDAWRRHVCPWLSDNGILGRNVEPVTIKCFGLIEASLEERLGPLADRSNKPLAGTRISGGEFHLHVDPCGVDQVVMDACVRSARERLSPYDFGTDDEVLAGVVGSLLQERGQSLSTAESCTSGLISSAIVDVPGSSDWFRGGWVVYSNEMKIDCLELSPSIIEASGAVSREVVEAMARGSIARSGSDWALAVSGIAGPGGGTAEKPVGTVWIACHGPGVEVQRCFRFTGGRSIVRQRAAAASLQMLRWCLAGHDPKTVMSWDAGS